MDKEIRKLAEKELHAREYYEALGMMCVESTFDKRLEQSIEYEKAHEAWIKAYAELKNARGQ